MNINEESMKKLMLHSLLYKSYDEAKAHMNMTPAEEQAILEKFSAPDHPNEIALSLTKNKIEPGRLFSRGAMEKFLHMARLFIGGKILGNYEKTQKEPEVLTARIIVDHYTKEEYATLMKD